jgi:hypothetical protein
MVSLRTDEGKKKYREYIQTHPASQGCPLCEKESIKDFTYWKITENSFPYDKIAQTHHMVIPLRHGPEHDLHAEELEELKHIKATFINDGYDWIIEATHKNKSIPDHFHLHLIVGK